MSVPEILVVDGMAALRACSAKSQMAKRLCGALQGDVERTGRLLGWTPLVTVGEALSTTARHFLVHG